MITKPELEVRLAQAVALISGKPSSKHPESWVLSFVPPAEPVFDFSSIFRAIGGRWMGSAVLQWKVEKFLAGSGTSEPLEALSKEAQQVRSLALGICQQALVMRLPAHDEKTFARWVMKPNLAPQGARATLRRILQIAQERDDLSSAWGQEEWIEASTPPLKPSPPRSWQGLPVSPGRVQGVVGREILLFRFARPNAVEKFEGASALLFSYGGVLSHACSVARERGIPAVTAIGPDLEALVHARSLQGQLTTVEIDAESGLVTLLD